MTNVVEFFFDDTRFACHAWESPLAAPSLGTWWTTEKTRPSLCEEANGGVVGS